jgi:hypothetical protein
VASLLTDARKEANRDAVALFSKVAACTFRIIPPVSAAATQAGGPGVQIVSTTPRRADRTRLAGL